MMGKQDNQIQMVILDIDSIIPQDHLLRQIKKDLLTNSFFQSRMQPSVLQKKSFIIHTFISLYTLQY